jgi:hypothetical protein
MRDYSCVADDEHGKHPANRGVCRLTSVVTVVVDHIRGRIDVTAERERG